MSLTSCKAEVVVGLTQTMTKRMPKKFRFYVFSFFMSLIMSGVLSLVMLWIEADRFYLALVNWPGAWLLSLTIAFPVSLVAHRFSTKVCRFIFEHRL